MAPLGILFALAMAVITAHDGISRVDRKARVKARLQKPDITDIVFVGSNNWNYVMRNNGSYFYDSPDLDGNGVNAGGEFPRGSGKTIVYAAGLYIGTLKGGIPVVSETEFSTEFQPGRILNSNVPFQDLEADDPAATAQQVYMIDRTLSGDDYANWPADAPLGPNGEPGLIADAQTWVVFNDLNVDLSQEGVSLSPDPGLGFQVTLQSFAFNAGPLSNVVYLKFEISNKTNVDYAESYLGLWMDPDIDADNASNDIVGVDTARGLGFCYNSDNTDFPAATGFDFFQGPVVEASDVSATLAAKYVANTSILVYNPSLKRYVPTNLPAGQIWLGATSFNTYANGTDPNDNEERYNFLAGRFEDGTPKTGQGIADYYAFRGNPITGQGTPDVAAAGNAADQRMLHGVGPFTIRAGDKQEIWAGVIGAVGTDRLSAVANMFTTDDLAQETFNAGLVAPAPPSVPKIVVTSLDGRVAITWQNNAESSADEVGEILGISTANGYTTDYEKYDFQGYRVYRSRTGIVGSYSLLAQYDKADGITTVINNTINTAGNLEVREIRVGNDTGLRYSYIDKDVINGQGYYYSVTAYDAQPYIAGPGSFSLKETKWIIETEATGVILEDQDAGTAIWDTEPIYLDSLAFATDAGHAAGPGAGIGDDTLYVMTDTNTVLEDTSIFVLRPFVVTSLDRAKFSFDYNTLAAAFRKEGTDDPSSVNVGDGVSFLVEFPFSDGHDESNIFRLEVKHTSNFGGSVPAPSGLPISLETSPTANVVLAVPMKAVIGKSFDATADASNHTSGASDGRVEIEVIDPTRVTGHSYRVEFFDLSAADGYPGGGVAYRLLDVNLGNTPVQFTSRVDDPNTAIDERLFCATISSGNENEEEFALADGLLLKVFGPPLVVKGYGYTGGTGTGSRWMTGINFGFEQFFGGLTLGINFFGSTVGPADYRDIDVVFSNDPSGWSTAYGHGPGGTGAQNKTFTVPFSAYEVDPTDGDPTPKQVNVAVRDANGLNGWFLDNTLGGDGTGPQTRSYVHITNDPYDAGAGSLTGIATGSLPILYSMDMAPRNSAAQAWNSLVAAAAAGGLTAAERDTVYTKIPDNGTFHIYANHVITALDTFTFNTTGNTVFASKKELKAALKNILVVPNPYYGRSKYQQSLFDKRIKFTNLPGSCTIRIFTIAGDLIATVAHNATSANDRINTNPLDITSSGNASETSSETWDVRNTDGKYVASGMYVALIQAPGVGKRTVKFAVIQEEITINGPDNR